MQAVQNCDNENARYRKHSFLYGNNITLPPDGNIDTQVKKQKKNTKYENKCFFRERIFQKNQNKKIKINHKYYRELYSRSIISTVI